MNNPNMPPRKKPPPAAKSVWPGHECSRFSICRNVAVSKELVRVWLEVGEPEGYIFRHCLLLLLLRVDRTGRGCAISGRGYEAS